MYYIINGDDMQRFKPKRRIKKIAIFKTIIFIIIIFILFKSFTNLFTHHKELIIKTMFLDEKYNYKKESSNIFSEIYEYARDNMVNIPSNMLETKAVYKKLPANSKTKDELTKEKVIVHNSDKSNNEPLIYLYNSHQKEGYSKEYMEDYNVMPDVFLASHIMQEKLNNKGFKTMVMEDDITAYLNNNKLDYSKSYEASRYYLKPAIDKYKSVKLFIDLHRDSTSKEVSTTSIGDKSYAKVMFVIGKEYNTYESNLAIANNINNKVESIYPTLSRGVLEKEGYGVNGVYNQDLASNIILIELGGDKNNLEEVTNTIDVLVDILMEYVNEK